MGTPRDCNDWNECTVDLCDPAIGCVREYNTAGCTDDGNMCTRDVCYLGVCTHQPANEGAICFPEPDPPEPCSDYVCENGGCVYKCWGGAECDDGDPCTENDVCRPYLWFDCFCLGDDKNCDDGNDCTTDSCADGECVHDNNSALCDDGDYCTDPDVCSGGSCQPGGERNCSDGKPCTRDSCSGTACQHTPDDALCDDENTCTNDDCVAGYCEHPARTGPL